MAELGDGLGGEVEHDARRGVGVVVEWIRVPVGGPQPIQSSGRACS